MYSNVGCFCTTVAVTVLYRIIPIPIDYQVPVMFGRVITKTCPVHVRTVPTEITHDSTHTNN